MNETRYLFKNASDVFNIGPNTHCPCSSGHYRQTHQVIEGVDWVGFVNLGDPKDVFQPLPVTSYLKNADGDPYADLVELEAAIAGFFFRVGASSGKLPESVVMAGVLDQVDYELTGKVVDTSAFYYAIVDQVIMSKGAELSILSGTDSIATFTAAPNDGATIIFVFYTV